METFRLSVKLLFFVFLFVYCGRGPLLALKSGVANGGGKLYRKNNAPIGFWFTVVGQMILTLVFAGLFTRAFVEYFSDWH